MNLTDLKAQWPEALARAERFILGPQGRDPHTGSVADIESLRPGRAAAISSMSILLSISLLRFRLTDLTGAVICISDRSWSIGPSCALPPVHLATSFFDSLFRSKAVRAADRLLGARPSIRNPHGTVRS